LICVRKTKGVFFLEKRKTYLPEADPAFGGKPRKKTPNVGKTTGFLEA
jgi:hypothetical protein